MSHRHYSEDGPEDTGAYVGGVHCSGHNGSLQLYRPQRVEFCKPSAERRAVLAEVRKRLAARAAETARRQAKG